jgi:RNA polymerase sigma-70 factor (ECF subfamily)
MPGHSADAAREQVDATYRAESRRVLATLIRLVGDFDLAEEAMHDAFAAALEQWPTEGVPRQPRAWLVSTGRFKAIDVLPAATLEAAVPDIGGPCGSPRVRGRRRHPRRARDRR